MKIENVSKVLDAGPLSEPGMAEAVTVRKAQFDDLRVMAQLIGELFAIESDFAIDLEKQHAGLKLLFEEKDADILVAKYKNTAIGMVTMQRVISSAEGGYAGLIEDVIVSEAYRGMGVGSRLIEETASLARARGYVRLQLGADIDNAPALAFYLKHGFEKSNLNLYYRKGI